MLRCRETAHAEVEIGFPGLSTREHVGVRVLGFVAPPVCQSLLCL